MPFLDDKQLKAIGEMHNGCVLCGGVGSGKSRTALAYYFKEQRGVIGENGVVNPMEPKPQNLYIITTAQKRDRNEWEGDMIPFDLSTSDERLYDDHIVVIDSWNNLHKYIAIKGSFFIFDEQHAGGHGKWAKDFVKIAKQNHWILLSATPADTWLEYANIFIANGFYPNITAFKYEHCEYDPYLSFPRVKRYWGTKKLERLRDSVLVHMDVERATEPQEIKVQCKYNRAVYKELCKTRWNIFENKPIKNASEFCYLLRRVVNSDDSRKEEVLAVVKDRQKVIIFYNFDYELEILRDLDYPEGTEIGEWNGHRHDAVPSGERWVYLVNYAAGSEGWNCITTDTILFYSQTYSYKAMVQAKGRIDRRNTPYKFLYYYILSSNAPIDLAIKKALSNKKDFNAKKFAGDFVPRESIDSGSANGDTWTVLA